MLVSRILAVPAALLVCLTCARAEEPLWKTVGQWTIRIDRTLNFGCFMTAVYERGTAFRIGFDRTNANGYVMFGNLAWQSLEAGKEYSITLQFDDEPSWQGTATAVHIGADSAVFLAAPFNKPSIMVEFMRKQALKIFYRGNLVTSLSLRGSYAAIQELLNCQSAVNEAMGSPSPQPKDPFASSRPANSKPDPFSD